MRKRIAHVALDYGAPSETFIVDAVEFTEQEGWESWVFPFHVWRRDWFPYPPDERIVTVRPLSVGRRVMRRARLHDISASQVERVWPGAAERVAPDIVMAHYAYGALYGAPLAERTGAPLVTIFHATDVSVFPHLKGVDRVLGAARGRKHRLDRVLSRIDVAIAVSGWVAQELRALGYEGRIEEIPVGIRLERFPMRDQQPDPEPTKLVFVGRLVERKGPDTLLRAAAMAGMRLQSPLTVDVVGDGPMRPELEALAEDLRLDVHFHGAQPPGTVAGILRRSHLLAMTSRTLRSGERESSPMALKEAMATGLPVVTTNSGGAAAILPPKYRHEAVPEDDIGALTTRIVGVLSDPEIATRIAIARTWVEQQFDARVVGARTVAIFDELTNR